MPIWDNLPPEGRRKYLHARLTPGRVLLLHCDFTTPPKDKYLVLVSTEPGPLFFVINSSINEYIRNRDSLFQCQVEIAHEEHAFLRRHSFIDCTTAHKIALHDIYEQLEGNIERLKDAVSPSAREQIIAAVKYAKTLAVKHKSAILVALEEDR